MIKKATIIIFCLLFIPALLATINTIYYAVSAADAVQWTAVNIPYEGSTGGMWKLANGSEIQQLTLANDGTLYCYANPSGTTRTLFKSTDSGCSWTTTGKVTDVIIDIAALPQDHAAIYYATTSCIYKSVDGGNTFISLPPNPGGAGSGNVLITSIDVVRVGDANFNDSSMNVPASSPVQQRSSRKSPRAQAAACRRGTSGFLRSRMSAAMAARRSPAQSANRNAASRATLVLGSARSLISSGCSPCIPAL